MGGPRAAMPAEERCFPELELEQGLLRMGQRLLLLLLELPVLRWLLLPTLIGSVPEGAEAEVAAHQKRWRQ